MGADWRVKVRQGPKVEKAGFGDAGEAFAWIEGRGRELERAANARRVDLPLGRSFEPVQQVTARIEVRGPRRARGGIDVRGDGSSEAWTGRVGRSVVEQRDGESPYSALRRAL